MACSTCKSDRCGNHAACARREAARLKAAAENQDRAEVWRFSWQAAWLFIGAWAHLTILSSISNATLRQAACDRANKNISTDMLRFMLFATSPDVDVRRTALLARRIIES